LLELIIVCSLQLAGMLEIGVWMSQKIILKMATAFMLMIYQQIYVIVNILIKLKKEILD
jgi:hypothetical protein